MVGASGEGTAATPGAGGAAPDELPWAVGEVIAERYRITGVLGTGGMGVVYAAEHLETGRPIAIKALLPEVARSKKAEARLMREARLVGRIRHRNIVDVFDVGRHDGVPFLVMERLEGWSLDAVIRRGPVAPADAVALLAPAMRGIAAAHAAGVVHRDLKPENVFLCLDARRSVREVKVLDFGVSKTYEAANEETRLTRSGMVVGTPRYMAPEQLTGADVDARADVFALGMILYELVSGRLPFEGDTFALLASNKIHGEPTPLRDHVPEVPPAFAAVLERALAREPAARFGSVEALAAALAPFTGDASFASVIMPLPEPTGKRAAVGATTAQVVLPTPRRSRLAMVAVAAMVAVGSVATGAAVVWLLEGRTRGADDGAVAEPSAPGEAAPDEAASADPTAPRPAEPAAEPSAERVAVEVPVAPEGSGDAEGSARGGEDEPPAAGATSEDERLRMRGRRSRRRGRSGTLSWDDF